MPEQSTPAARTPVRPFPWFCPKCRRKEVQRTTIPYQCQRVYEGQAINVDLASLAVPKCGHCGELVFDADAEEQINQAYAARLKTLKLDGTGIQGPVAPRVLPAG